MKRQRPCPPFKPSCEVLAGTRLEQAGPGSRSTRPRVRASAMTPRTRVSELREEIEVAKYGKKAAEKVRRAMRERRRGTLRSGRSGKRVTSRKQAIAIGLSEARRAGGKVPRKRGKSSRKSSSRARSSS